MKKIKLCDFGNALSLSEAGITEYIASRYYRAPEIILGCKFDTQVDMWSLGATLSEACTGKILFPGISNHDMIRLMLNLKGIKMPEWMIKEGQFSNKHFDAEGKFIMREQGPLRVGTDDLMAALKAANKKADAKVLVFFKDFLQKCLTIDPKERLCPEDALGHPFIGLKAKKRIEFKNN